MMITEEKFFLRTNYEGLSATFQNVLKIKFSGGGGYAPQPSLERASFLIFEYLFIFGPSRPWNTMFLLCGNKHRMSFRNIEKKLVSL